MTDIKPGDLVVCVDDNWGEHRNETCPIKGTVYTVRELFCIGGVAGLWLEEIINNPRQYLGSFGEIGFMEKRFRPVRDDSIDIFRELVANPPKELVR